MKHPLQNLLLTRNSGNPMFWDFPLLTSKGSEITLYHGTKSCSLNWDKLPRTPDHKILLTQEISKILRLSETCPRYQLRALCSNHFIIGPLVGILVSEKALTRLLSGKSNSLYRSYARVLSRHMGQAVLISPKRIQWEHNEVQGVIRAKTNQVERWLEETLPLPTVIYDRCFGGNNRYRSTVIRKKCASHHPTVKVINALPKIGKREIYTLCSQISRFQEHLPRWDILRPDNIETVLENFPVAYIKPNRLSKGKGVTKVTKTSSGYLLEQRRDPKNYKHLCQSPKEVLDELESYIRRQGFMVIQEGIPLMTYEGRPFDFRLLLQKDHSGHWKRTGIAGRISGAGSIISSPRSGGSVAPFGHVMAPLSPTERQSIASSMINLALDLAQTLDSLIGPFVELGFDFGVDTNGKVRIIEVNGIPLKVSIERLGNQETTQSANNNPLSYAITMAGFGGF